VEVHTFWVEFSGVLSFVLGIDHRCNDGHFPAPASCVTISNPPLFPAVKHGSIQNKMK
jgi:hypothetical protein